GGGKAVGPQRTIVPHGKLEARRTGRRKKVWRDRQRLSFTAAGKHEVAHAAERLLQRGLAGAGFTDEQRDRRRPREIQASTLAEAEKVLHRETNQHPARDQASLPPVRQAGLQRGSKKNVDLRGLGIFEDAEAFKLGVADLDTDEGLGNLGAQQEGVIN